MPPRSIVGIRIHSLGSRFAQIIFAAVLANFGRTQLSGCLIEPFCQPLPYAHESFVTDRADAAGKQFAVEDGEARQAEDAGGFQAGVGEVGTAGVMISSSPSSACWVCDETMQTSQSSKLADACRNMSTGRSFVSERSV